MPTSPKSNLKPRTPEQREAYRARLIAENRCANCAAPRPPGDNPTACCDKCRARKNNGSNKAYAQARAENPPDFARAPAQPFRYGKTRLDAPRRVTVTLDQETYDLIHACRRNYCLSPAYEPYQVSEVIRRLLTFYRADIHAKFANQAAWQEDTYARHAFGPRPFVPSGLTLCFMCDAPNVALLTATHETIGGTFAEAVRICIRRAAQIALALESEEAKRLLWPGYADLTENTE